MGEHWAKQRHEVGDRLYCWLYFTVSRRYAGFFEQGTRPSLLLALFAVSRPRPDIGARHSGIAFLILRMRSTSSWRVLRRNNLLDFDGVPLA